MGANEMVVGDLKSQVSVEFVFVFRKRERLSLQRRIFSTQGQVEPFNQAGAYIL